MTVAQLKKHLDSRLSRLERRHEKRFSAIDLRFCGVDERFASMDQNFSSIDEKFAAMEARFDGKFAGGDARFESVTEKLDAILGFVRHTHEHTTRILDEHERRLQAHERR